MLEFMDVPGISRGPNAILSRRKDSLGINGILDGLVETHQRIVVPVIRTCNLVHEGQMGSIFTPAIRCAILDEGPNEPMGLLLLDRVFSVEHDAHNVVWYWC